MRYQAIYKSSLADGLGWRTVLFVSGCEHHCIGCHNREAWDRNSGKEFTNDDLNIIINELKKPYMDGLTLSGGDPLMEYNRADVEELCKQLKTILPEKTIWLYTGYDWEEIKSLPLLKYVDVLVDGKFMLELRDTTIAFRGSPNQRIIDVQKSLATDKVVVLELDN